MRPRRPSWRSSASTSGRAATTTWAGALEAALADRGWTLATTERGTDGALVELLRSLPAVVLAERRSDAAGGRRRAGGGRRTVEVREAGRVRVASGADVGLAIGAIAGGEDTTVPSGS